MTNNNGPLQEYLLEAAKTNRYVSLKNGAGGARKGVTLKTNAPAQGVKQQKADAPPSKQVDVLTTVRHYLVHNKTELHYKRERSKADMYVFFLIDSSASMVKDKQVAYIKGLVEQTIARYKTKRIRYAAVALSNGTAKLLSPPTTNAAALLSATHQLTTGGKTNLKAGFAIINQLMKTNIQQKASLYIFTDGRVNAGETADPFGEAVTFYKKHLSTINETTVINNDHGFIQLGLAEKLATAIGAKCSGGATYF